MSIITKEKVLAYITRKTQAGMKLLVFKHRDFPEAGIQVPSGTVETDEDLTIALKREIEEESGLTFLESPKKIGTYLFYRKDKNENHLRHVFHVESTAHLPDQWTHTVTGHGEDSQIVLQYYWMNAVDAKQQLTVDQGEYLVDLVSTKPHSSK